MTTSNWSVNDGDYNGGKIYDDYRKSVIRFSKYKKLRLLIAYGTLGFLALYITLIFTASI
ncbi:MAG: hypothetical protein HUU54_07095 [Ignavibacteriaceae bacterium]|nr:hypothetical protein [Ignavibacteriaceae bacterium]